MIGTGLGGSIKVGGNAQLRYQPLPAPVGLINSGTTCYFNASLQCLLACPVFIQFLLNLHQLVPPKAHVTDVLDMLAGHVGALSSTAKRKTLDVTPVLRSVRKASQDAIRINRQEDSHEAMCVLFDMMEKACLTRMGLPTSTRVDNTSESTLVHDMFGGSNTTTTTCPNCKHRSPKTESFLQLSLELDGNKAASVPQLLKKMSQVEKLDAKNLWECEKCKKKVMAERKTSISKAPTTLIIHLKRFGFSFLGGSMKRTKLRTPVIIGSEDLTIDDMEGKKIDYSLVGVLVHRGATLNSGHYFSYIKCAANNMWYEADDEMISRVKTTDVLGEREAYMLFYGRKDALRALKPTGLVQQPMMSKAVGESNGVTASTPVHPMPKARADLTPTAATPGAFSTAMNGSAQEKPVPRAGPESSPPPTESSVDDGTDDEIDEEDVEDVIHDWPASSPPPRRRSLLSLFEASLTIRKSKRRWYMETMIPRMLRRVNALRPIFNIRRDIMREARTASSKNVRESEGSPVKRARVATPIHSGPKPISGLSKSPEMPERWGPAPVASQQNASVVITEVAVASPASAQSSPAEKEKKTAAGSVEVEAPFSFDRKPKKKKVFEDAWDAHLDKGRTKKVRTKF